MASPHTIERQRGASEARQQLEVLREKWPLAFLLQDARPLAMGTVGHVAETMGWSVPYTIGVLTYWKMTPFYCRAVLAHDQRITLDGAPAEPVDAEAKELATKQLTKLAARNAARQAAADKAKPKPAPPTGGCATARADWPPPRKARQRPSRERGRAFHSREQDGRAPRAPAGFPRAFSGRREQFFGIVRLIARFLRACAGGRE